jgi:hypothetical protein
VLLHNDKTGTIYQTPVFVRPRFQERPGIRVETRVNGNQVHVAPRFDGLDARNDLRAGNAATVREQGDDFRTHLVRRHQASSPCQINPNPGRGCGVLRLGTIEMAYPTRRVHE